MAKKSEIKVKRLISLFEPTTEIQSEEIQRRASLHNIRQEFEEMCPKEDSGANKMAVLHIVRDFPVPSVSSELPHKGDKPALPPKVDKPRIDKEEITVQPLTNLSSADKPRPTHMEKPKRIKDLRELLKISTNENDRLRSELLTLTKKLESVENAFETFKKEHKLRVEESVKLVETTTLDQSSVTDRDELRTAQEELAKEKQIRMIVEKRLKVANTKISDLINRLKEKDRELLTYKAEREDLKKADEDQKEEKRIQPESPGQPSEANEKKAEPIQRLDYITNRTSEIDATSETQKRLTRADTDLEISDSDLKLFARQVKGRKKSQRPHLRTGMQVKSLDLDDGNYLEADLGKHENYNEKKTLDSTASPVYSLPFPELSEVCHPIPNLYSGLNRPKRKKQHSVRSPAGSLARSEELVVVYV